MGKGRGLINFLPLKRLGGGGFFETEVLIEDLRYERLKNLYKQNRARGLMKC